ncbi:hypothetical protein NA56DRAFT_680077 [Hyaloscypha hepaticicola]|uniref:Aldehyde dehydrogenase domain-containing protein n=1 Tax=Hyaloscypha hepaticicola TaxID=2082293 RepID=A0A2J6Q089_9HELO|nr:hypothetical protein NA56DRAFT_680077 [Hyaloscypha hepaticicola]
MGSDFETAFKTLRSSVAEGRAENHLRENAELLCEAIAKDYAGSPIKAETEFFLTMDAARGAYERLDFDKSLKEEYSVKFGKDNSERRAALGLVAIRPSTHSRFYSTVTPLVAALEAGNCVIIELDLISSCVDSLLSEILPRALDRDTFHISKVKLDSKWADQLDLTIDQSAVQGRTICILDRTGDIEFASQTITASKLPPEYTSPYSPDLVLVNEYLVSNFRTRCLEIASKVQTSPKRVISDGEKDFQKLLKEAEAKKAIIVHRSNTSDFSAVELKKGSSKLATIKVKGPYLLFLPTTGIVDSVNSQRSLPPLLASYIFASPAASKFIAEQVPSHATYINQIPSQILVGPASLVNYPHALHPRFTSNMLSTPRPQFITPPTPLPTASKLKELALKPLKPTGQRPGHAIGFFEPGILLGLGSTAIVVLPFLVWSLVSAVNYGMRYLRQT